MKRILKSIIKFLFSVLPYRYVVIMIDGGIASQINKLMVGYTFVEKYGKKAKVLYDTDWFGKYGMDIDGINVRNFEVDKLYPDIEIKEAGKLVKYVTKSIYKHVSGYPDSYENVEEIPLDHLYIDGYGYLMADGTKKIIIDKYLYKRVADTVLDVNNLEMLKRIREAKYAVGVHVRRGDMARNKDIYDATSKEYFVKAMMDTRFIGSDFFIFSDDMDWVKEELIPVLPDSDKYHTVDINGNDRGYCDLYLCSECDAIISSQGSMARFSAMIRNNIDTLLICPKELGTQEAMDNWTFGSIKSL